MSGLKSSAYVSVAGESVTPKCITRFGAGTRVEVRWLGAQDYAVQAVPSDILRVFGEETWTTDTV